MPISELALNCSLVNKSWHLAFLNHLILRIVIEKQVFLSLGKNYEKDIAQIRKKRERYINAHKLKSPSIETAYFLMS